MGRSDDRLKILVSEGSSNSARQALYGLGTSHHIDIVDPSPWCQCRSSSLVRRWYRCPLMAEDPIAYVRFVADLLKRNGYDVLFPTHEQAYVFSRFRDAFGNRVGLAVPPFEAMCRLQSKARWIRLLNELDLPAPPTRIVRSEEEALKAVELPCYVKLPYSTASLGVFRVSTRDALLAVLHRLQKTGSWSKGSELLLQRPATGRQSEVSAVFQEGRLVAAACAEVLATGIGGGPALRVSADHPIVADHVRQLGARLGWHGPLVLEYFYDSATGKPEYIEANPRIGEAMNAIQGGLNLCDLVVRISLGQYVDLQGPAKTGVRTHNGFVILIADAYNGAGRFQLLRRMWQSWRGRGIYRDSASEMTRPREDRGSLIPALAVSLRLLASPGSARRLAENTVANYSLSPRAVRQLAAPAASIARVF